MHDCWIPNPETGFLIHPAPLLTLPDDIDGAQHLEVLAAGLPELMATRQVRAMLDDLPIYNLDAIADCRTIERAFQIYAYFATAYIYAPDMPAIQHLPAGVAVPFVALAERVQRPPIMAYASYTLLNWRLRDPDGGIVVDNLELVQSFITVKDAVWFTLIHVDIEARAAAAIAAIPALLAAAGQHDTPQIETALQTISTSLEAMMTTLRRMPEHCHPHVYYHQVRPYMFGFDDIVYQGVTRYAGQPQSFRGETGAQSSIIPALVQALGIQHEESNLTRHLHIMRDYMPAPHRDFLDSIDGQGVRALVAQETKKASLRDAYNTTMQQVLRFRQMHLRFAASYIANQAPTSKGTGGTDFMMWLQKLIDETAEQLLIR